jgi:hypothetical protein
VRTLILDRLVHSYTSVNDPRKLVYGYEKASAEVLEYLDDRDGRLDAFFIGGGGYTLPRYIEHMYPGRSTVEVSEIDPGVTEVVYQQLGLSRNTAIRTFNEDARLFLATLEPARRYTVVFGDAFNDFSVPYHLTTHEFNQLVRRHLTDDGLLAFTRWGLEPPRESLRLLSLARVALDRLGEREIWRHVIVVREGKLTDTEGWGAMDTVLISRKPFTPEDLARARQLIGASGYQPLYLPVEVIPNPITELLRTKDVAAFEGRYPYNIRPVDDNRPFFFY